MTEFEPLGGDRFRYEAIADVAYPASSEGAEADRMEWLATWLADNKLCAAGFEITERKAVLMQRAIFGDWHRIYYEGRCTTHQPAHR